MSFGFTGIAFVPLIPWQAIATMGGLALAMIIWGVSRGARGAALRVLAVGILVLALFNPRLESETRDSQPDIAIVVVDESSSQNTGNRREQVRDALADIEKQLGRFDDLEVRIIRGVETEDGTELFGELDRAISDMPKDRFAGAVMITDGQVHDAPKPKPAAPADTSDSSSEAAPADDPLKAYTAPLHVLLTGSPDERDRRLVVERAPAFGIVGKGAKLALRVEDRPGKGSGRARVQIRVGGGDPRTVTLPVGQVQEVEIPIEHGGDTIVELEVEELRGEMSQLNNRAVVVINGVRDRLRVLLVSGQPHAGERTWRNLLKSDPSVDLVHFTILRPPEKNDFTPLNELALISFPIRELFEVKLHEFDMIVFDRYIIRFVLPQAYFQNIEKYVRGGGAILLALGPDFSGTRSLYHTPLGKVLPGVPTGKMLDGSFRAAITDQGRRHPVTAGPGVRRAEKNWGRWLRQIDSDARGGVTVMTGNQGKPLLVLDRVEKGRVAQFLSDHIWLWARGYEGGGPHSELMRRLSHWLMKEPDLEEEDLRATVDGDKLSIVRRSLAPKIPPVKMTSPSGNSEIITLEPQEDGSATATVTVDETGIYRLEDGNRRALAAVGTLNPPEFTDLRASADRLEPVIKASGGGIHWVANGLPDYRRIKPGRSAAGNNWIGLRRNGAYVVTGVRQVPLLPGLVFLLLALGLMMLAWWREGQ